MPLRCVLLLASLIAAPFAVLYAADASAQTIVALGTGGATVLVSFTILINAVRKY